MGPDNNPTTLTDYGDEEPTSIKLERLTRAVAAMFNDKDFEFTSPSAQEVKAHLSPDLMYKGTEPAKAISFEEQRQVWIQLTKQNPGTCYKVLETSSTVSEHLGRASVFMTLILTGTLGINLQIFTEFKWRREDGIWKCWWVSDMQSMPEPGNEFDSRVD